MFEEIAAIIAEQLGLEIEEVKPESRLVEDLKADSLDVMAMIMEIEDTYGVEIPDEELTNFKTVNDAVGFVENRKK